MKNKPELDGPDPLAEQVWALAVKNDFTGIIKLLQDRGVSHEDIGEMLFEFSKQAMEDQNFKAARQILVFLIDSLEDQSEAAQLKVLVGDLYAREGRYEKALEYYGQLTVTFENIKKIFCTFVLLKDIDGLLAVRDNILIRLKKPTDENEIHRLVHTSIVEIAEELNITKRANDQYLINLEHLQKIDPFIKARFNGDTNNYGAPSDLTCMRVFDKIYFRESNAWEIAEQRPAEHKIHRERLKHDMSIAVRCRSLGQLSELRDALATDKPYFHKYLCYLIVEPDLWEHFMMVEDLSPFINCDFIIRLIDENNFEGHFKEVLIDEKNIFPGFLVNFSTEEDYKYSKEYFLSMIDKCKKMVNLEIKKYNTRLAVLYPVDFSKMIQDRIRSKKLRILLPASNYSTFVKYATRDMAEGFKKLGCEVFIEIEEEGAPIGIRGDICLKNLIEFRPDFIFVINHLRYERSWFPRNIPYVTWVQDKLEHVSSGEYLNELTNNDILFTQTFYDELIDVGYNDVLRLPVPVNLNKFNKVPENDEWAFDISYVNHAPTKIFPVKDQTGENYIRSDIVFSILAEEINREGNNVISILDYRKLLSDTLAGQPNLDWVLEMIRDTIGNYLHRTIVIDWLIENGYKPALYGKGWQDMPAYSSMAKGEISHGMELATIYNESKINLHMHPYTTTHQRVFESIASGGFLLVKFIDPVKDLNPLEKYLEEGEGFLYFHDKEDLIEKVNLYISDDQKRNEIVEKGREKVLKKYTYERAAKYVLETVSERLREF